VRQVFECPAGIVYATCAGTSVARTKSERVTQVAALLNTVVERAQKNDYHPCDIFLLNAIHAPFPGTALLSVGPGYETMGVTVKTYPCEVMLLM